MSPWFWCVTSFYFWQWRVPQNQPHKNQPKMKSHPEFLCKLPEFLCKLRIKNEIGPWILHIKNWMQTKSLTNPGGCIFGCDTIPQSPGRPYIKEAEEPRAYNGIKRFQNGASGAAASWREYGRLKITYQSRGMNFRMWSHPLICQPSIFKRSGRTRAFR